MTRRVSFRDSTLREGLDTPGVGLSAGQRAELLGRLDRLGVAEAEVVAPGHFEADLEMVRGVAWGELAIRPSGLVYAQERRALDQVLASAQVLRRVDLLVPLAAERPPLGAGEKVRCVREALGAALELRRAVGVGFPHAMQADDELLAAACQEAAAGGAERITLYDTNGGADPFAVAERVGRIRALVATELWFHAHNDLGMATANSVAAVLAGADGLDVTVNGLGDRAGNASLEQVAVALHLRGVAHGLRLDRLPELSAAVAAASGIPVPPLAPVVGAFAHRHKSPGHLEQPALFEAFDPALIGGVRSVCSE